MTSAPAKDPRLEKIMAELTEIGTRLESGDISEDQAKSESDRIMAEVQKQSDEGIAAYAAALAQRERFYRRNRIILAVGLVASLAIWIAYRYLWH